MLKLIFIFLFLMITIFLLAFNLIFRYHFKRFQMIDDEKIKRILNFFTIGSVFFLICNFLFLIFIF